MAMTSFSEMFFTNASLDEVIHVIHDNRGFRCESLWKVLGKQLVGVTIESLFGPVG